MRRALHHVLLVGTLLGSAATADAQTTWDAWGGGNSDQNNRSPDRPPPPPPPDEPDEPPDLEEEQTESFAFGVDFGMSPLDTHPVRAAIDIVGMLFPKAHRREDERKIHFGGIFHVYAGLGASRILHLDGSDDWKVRFIAGGDASIAFIDNHGLFLRVGVDLRFVIRKLPTRIYISPQIAFGHAGKNASFEVGIAYEPYPTRRADDGMGSAWDVTERTLMPFFRVHFAPQD